MRCTSRIVRRYKKAKADPMWPEYAPRGIPIPNDQIGDLEQCDGEVTIKLVAVNEAEMGGTWAKLELDAECTVCKYPYFPNRIAVENEIARGSLDITTLVEEAQLWGNIKRNAGSSTS